MTRDLSRNRRTSARAWTDVRLRHLAVVLGAAGLLALAPSAATSKTFPCPKAPHEPCKGPIEVVTNYSGYKEGPLSLIKLTLGPSRKVGGETHEQFLTKPEIFQRVASWHSVADVEIVAVFILHRPKPGQFHYQPIPTGKHGGHVTLTDDRQGNAEPMLIVQGRKISGRGASRR